MEKFSAYRVGATSLPPIHADLDVNRTREPEYRCLCNSTHIIPRWHWKFQPFLTPVPPVGSEFLTRVTLPVRYTLGFIRTALILFLALVYVLLVRGVCFVLVKSRIFLSRPSSLDFLIASNSLLIPFGWTHIHLYSRTISTSHPWCLLDLTRAVQSKTRVCSLTSSILLI